MVPDPLQDPGSAALDVVQFLEQFVWKAEQETLTVINPSGNKCMNKLLSISCG